jgi:hypothetical protein
MLYIYHTISYDIVSYIMPYHITSYHTYVHESSRTVQRGGKKEDRWRVEGEHPAAFRPTGAHG